MKIDENCVKLSANWNPNRFRINHFNQMQNTKGAAWRITPLINTFCMFSIENFVKIYKIHKDSMHLVSILLYEGLVKLQKMAVSHSL